jgi:hypothetical protein
VNEFGRECLRDGVIGSAAEWRLIPDRTSRWTLGESAHRRTIPQLSVPLAS